MDRSQNKALRKKVLDILRTSDELVRTFKNQIEGKNVVVFIGNTRSGKSTLVNYIVGHPLMAFKTGDYFKIKLQDSCGSIATIGQGSLSHTTVPNVIEIQDDPDTLIVDAPGFDDNRGVLQEIVNVLYINQIKHAKGVKFVLVADSNNIIADNINYFLNFVETVETVMPDFAKLKEAVSIIFTKDWKEYTKTEMVDLLKMKILDVHGMRGKKDLICHFVECNDLIGLFKMPIAAGPLSKNIDDNVHNAILHSAIINLTTSDIKFGLSNRASVFLLETYLEFHDIVIALENIFNDFVKSAKEKFSCLESDDKLSDLTDQQLKKSNEIIETFHQSSDVVLDHFSLISEVLPNLLHSLFMEKLNKASNALNEIEVRSPQENDTTETSLDSIEDVRKKLQYIHYLEKIIERNDKSKNIWTCFKNCINDMNTELINLSHRISSEIKWRDLLYKKIPDILKSSIKDQLKQIDKPFLEASSLHEVSKMDSHLENYLSWLNYILKGIEKRSPMKETLSNTVDEVSQIRSCVSKKKVEIVEFKKYKENSTCKYLPPLNISTLKNRFQQNHIFKANILDNCCDIFSDQDFSEFVLLCNGGT